MLVPQRQSLDEIDYKCGLTLTLWMGEPTGLDHGHRDGSILTSIVAHPSSSSHSHTNQDAPPRP